MSDRDDLQTATRAIGTDWAREIDTWLNGILSKQISWLGWVRTTEDTVYTAAYTFTNSAPPPINIITVWLFSWLWNHSAYYAFWAAQQPLNLLDSILVWLWNDPAGHYHPAVATIVAFDALTGPVLLLYDLQTAATSAVNDLVWQVAEAILWRVGLAVGGIAQTVAGGDLNPWYGIRDGYDNSWDAIAPVGANVGGQIVNRVASAQIAAQSALDTAIASVGANVNALATVVSSTATQLSDSVLPRLTALGDDLGALGNSITALDAQIRTITDNPSAWILGHIAESVVDWLGDRVSERW